MKITLILFHRFLPSLELVVILRNVKLHTNAIMRNINEIMFVKCAVNVNVKLITNYINVIGAKLSVVILLVLIIINYISVANNRNAKSVIDSSIQFIYVTVAIVIIAKQCEYRPSVFYFNRRRKNYQNKRKNAIKNTTFDKGYILF